MLLHSLITTACIATFVAIAMYFNGLNPVTGDFFGFNQFEMCFSSCRFSHYLCIISSTSIGNLVYCYYHFRGTYCMVGL